MEFLELVRKRRSVRDYKPDPVPDAMLMHMLEAGRLAPTGANKQPQRLVVVREQAGRRGSRARSQASQRRWDRWGKVGQKERLRISDSIYMLSGYENYPNGEDMGSQNRPD